MPDTEFYDWDALYGVTATTHDYATIRANDRSANEVSWTSEVVLPFVRTDQMEEYIKRICKVITEHTPVDISEDEVMRLIKGE